MGEEDAEEEAEEEAEVVGEKTENEKYILMDVVVW